MRAIVTGVAGFIGSHVAEILARQGTEVLGIDDLSGGFEDNVPAGVAFEKRSITDPLDSLFKQFRPDAVYHLAAYAAEGLSHHIPVFNYINNTVGTANVLGATYRAQAKHFVFTSSIAAYGHPHSATPFNESMACNPCDPYGTAKLACEHHIRSVCEYHGGPAFTIFRPHNVFGSRQNVSDPYRNVVGIFMARALDKRPMPVFGDGLQTRSFSHISSVAPAIVAAPTIAGARNEVFNIGSDEAMSILELAQRISDVMGVPLNLDMLPSRREVQHAHCSHTRAQSVFFEVSSRALSIQEGLVEMADYVKNHPVPQVTECPAPIEVVDNLPMSWRNRLGL